MSTTTHVLDVVGVGPVDVTVTEQGDDQPFLLLHGGGGPNTMLGFAERFAASKPARTITPTHPGFGGTARPEGVDTIAKLAAVYVTLLDQLDVSDVTVVGNSIGGWIAAEIALLESPRVSGMIVVDAVGLDVPGHPVADFFSLTMDEVFVLSFHDPDPFRIDPTNLPAAAQTVMASDRAALAAYAGTSMTDPTLAQRLSTLEMPTLVLWGDSDRIVDPDYGRAYAAAIPMARFHLLADTGHLPQIETPDQFLDAIWDADQIVFPADTSVAQR